MNELKEGDTVTRKSYNSDIVFEIKNFFFINNEKMAILQGVTIRIEADSPLSDLELIEKVCEEKRNYSKKENLEFRSGRLVYAGRILHLDGDKKYSEKSANYYKKAGLNAIVRNIPEYKQYIYIETLLNRYNPDILVVTGHERIY